MKSASRNQRNQIENRSEQIKSSSEKSDRDYLLVCREISSPENSFWPENRTIGEQRHLWRR